MSKTSTATLGIGSTMGELAIDKHVQYTLDVEKVALVVLVLFNKLDMLDAEKVSNYIASLQNEDGSFAGDNARMLLQLMTILFASGLNGVIYAWDRWLSHYAGSPWRKNIRWLPTSQRGKPSGPGALSDGMLITASSISSKVNCLSKDCLAGGDKTFSGRPTFPIFFTRDLGFELLLEFLPGALSDGSLTKVMEMAEDLLKLANSVLPKKIQHISCVHTQILEVGNRSYGVINDLLYKGLLCTGHPAGLVRHFLEFNYRPDLTHEGIEKLIDDLVREITAAWLTDEFRCRKPTTIDEAIAV
ncbi:hypothetical protein H6P81_020699 [Aristolochia fimbriata]|uniref:Uncharacterized protein n=1 Tax=Aristolochia fimbriata TaxID=158543 RepID=A0AAV7DW75_ARIFI|nr:hypothetical protein H6P81_020699 [Aristolochia fimbriata]